MLTAGRRQRGFSLIELLLASAIGLSLLTGVIQLAARALTHNAEQLRALRAEQELRDIAALLRLELRRAGARRSHSLSAEVTAVNPFLQPDTQPQTADRGRCLLYAYDVNGNGRLDRGERLGVRLRDGTLQWRKNDRGCTSAGWERVTDPALLHVTAFQTRVHQRQTRLLDRQRARWFRVDIEIRAELPGGSQRFHLNLSLTPRNPALVTPPANPNEASHAARS